MVSKRIYKGRSLLIFPADYTVIDIETSGLSPEECEIIEISAVKVRNDKITDTFSQLIKPERRISAFITSLTGITNDMVKYAPDIKSVITDFADFIGSDILLGYNVNFDINFLYDNMVKHLGTPLNNDFVDVLRFS
ncbi:MAG: 3'-5' exonuclease, partial [Clostridia bacterium]|nr:3'-5' exonuclease [Clostridia bacterium]